MISVDSIIILKYLLKTRLCWPHANLHVCLWFWWSTLGLLACQMYTEPPSFSSCRYSLSNIVQTPLALHLHRVRHYKQSVDDWFNDICGLYANMMLFCMRNLSIAGFCICKEFWSFFPHIPKDECILPKSHPAKWVLQGWRKGFRWVWLGSLWNPNDICREYREIEASCMVVRIDIFSFLKIVFYL